jgi:hypothetical protein
VVAGLLVVLLVAVYLTTMRISGVNTSTRFRVVGTVLVKDGKRFIVRGSTIYVLPFYTDGASADPTLAMYTKQNYADRVEIFARMHQDGVNTVRIPVSVTGYRTNVYHQGGEKGYLRRLAAVVRSAQQENLLVIVGWWTSTGQSSVFQGAAEDDLAMDAAVYRTLAPDPGVIYEPYNEPPLSSWRSWERLMVQTIHDWRDIIGFRGVLLLDTIGFSWEFSAFYASKVLRSARSVGASPNVLFANHRYPNGARSFDGSARLSWLAQIGAESSHFPILGGEYGVYDGDGPVDIDWMRSFLASVATTVPAGFNGAVTFVWNWVDQNTLTDGPLRLSAYGRLVEVGLWRSAAFGGRS